MRGRLLFTIYGRCDMIKEDIRYVPVLGYGWTGGSAVVDMLREFPDIAVPANEKEFRLIKDPYGIIDLDRALNDSIDPLNEDIAIRNFKWMSEKYIKKPGRFSGVACGYVDDFGKNIERETEKYVDGLISYKYPGYWWFLDMEASAVEMIFKRILRKLKIRDLETYREMYLSDITESEFINLTRNYLYNLFSPLVSESPLRIVALDNVIPATHPSYGYRYFGDCRPIVVERDPRDVYVNLIKRKSLVGYASSKIHDPHLFIKWHKRQRVTNETMDNVLFLRFEDLVLHYEETANKIYSFIGVKKEQHVNLKKYFDPSVSKERIGMWRTYPYQDEIRVIENELGTYLYRE